MQPAAKVITGDGPCRCVGSGDRDVGDGRLRILLVTLVGDVDAKLISQQRMGERLTITFLAPFKPQ